MTFANSFFDTNVVLYLFSADAAKADRAEELIAPGGQISVQVLNELAAVARRKLEMSWREVQDVLTQVRAIFRVAPLTVETHERGRCGSGQRFRKELKFSTVSRTSCCCCSGVRSPSMLKSIS